VIDADGRPIGLSWEYNRAEIIADGVVHAVGVAAGIVGVIVLLILAAETARALEFTSVTIYSAGLLAMLGLSAAYNMWPVSRWKWLLRRFDHSAIYLLIAATYTPFIVHMKTGTASISLLAGVWLTAIVGIVLKLFLPGRFDRTAVVLYLLLGWSVVIAFDEVAAALPATTL
jgi:hemolysin III